MKDVPHHLAKFLEKNKAKENPETNECMKDFRKPVNSKQKKKWKKMSQKMKKEKLVHMPESIEEKNKKEKHRDIVLRENNLKKYGHHEKLKKGQNLPRK